MENKWKLSDEAILLFFYGKAIDLWIAEQGEDCLETDKEVVMEVIDVVANRLYSQYKKSSKKMN